MVVHPDMRMKIETDKDFICDIYAPCNDGYRNNKTDPAG